MEIIVRGYECQDDQWRTVTVLPCKPEGLKALWAIFKGTYKPRVKVKIEDHPERRHYLWDPQGRRSIEKSPLADHTPLTRNTIKYEGTVIRVGDHDLENTR